MGKLVDLRLISLVERAEDRRVHRRGDAVARIPPKGAERLGIRLAAFASGNSSGVLIPVTDRLSEPLQRLGVSSTPPRPAP